MFARLDLHTAAGVSLSELLDFIIDVDKGYFPNPYHNFFHAVDVTGVLFFILNDVRANRYLSKIDAMALLLAALCHDIGHVSLTLSGFCQCLLILLTDNLILLH
jgi:hypothetical protein